MLCYEMVDRQPELNEKSFWRFGGAYSDTQWYCAPAVGAALANSARDKTTKKCPQHAQMSDQSVPASPPFIKDVALVVRNISQAPITQEVKAIVEAISNFLRSCCFLPIRRISVLSKALPCPLSEDSSKVSSPGRWILLLWWV